MNREHNHYFKPCPFAEVDVYRTLQLFNVTDPCIQHAVKKLLVAGGRGAGKDIGRDVKEAIDTLERWQEMRIEEAELENIIDTAMLSFGDRITAFANKVAALWPKKVVAPINPPDPRPGNGSYIGLDHD